MFCFISFLSPFDDPVVADSSICMLSPINPCGFWLDINIIILSYLMGYLDEDDL